MANETKSFEERLERLKQIVAIIEGETRPLEETLALYEEGKKLIEELTKELKDAEEKVKKSTLVEDE